MGSADLSVISPRASGRLHVVIAHPAVAVDQDAAMIGIKYRHEVILQVRRNNIWPGFQESQRFERHFGRRAFVGHEIIGTWRMRAVGFSTE